MISKKVSRFLSYPYDKVPFWQRWMMRLPIQSLIYLMLIPVPLSVITLAYLLTVEKWSLLEYLLFVWSTCEIAFFISWKKQMQVPFKRKPFTGDQTARATLAKRFLAHAGNIQEAFAGWMIERPEESLHIEYFKPLINFFFSTRKKRI
ncbi:hypothetical protein DSO57_1016097 [Entomophthora muscae]|uniref:Uncharacterized protein n=1 Tax=Entomophthora muscae TaxID=34485 RepID=A0ACC2TSJ1_9FUNG|nr:hypothetical protein DSO57_1016097 [Entomophthora muscae]